MNKNIKISLGSIYLIVLLTFLYFLFSKFDVSRIDDFSYYKIIQENIETKRKAVIEMFLKPS